VVSSYPEESMRILVTSQHRYPADRFPVCKGGLAAFRVLDTLVKGLAELGHDVVYRLEQGAESPLPLGVRLTCDTDWTADIVHLQDRDVTEPISLREPWVRTCHADLAVRGLSRSYARDNWIFVSRTLAETYGRTRHVLNGIDPGDYEYSQQKESYFLVMCDLGRALRKGVDTAIMLADITSLPLVIAGSTNDYAADRSLRDLARGKPVKFAGEVQGKRKAELLAGAKALLFPTRINEAFGLVLAEALMSGTPVIASDYGACPEMVTPGVGFVCKDMDEFIRAMDRVGEISPEACRHKAMTDFHYLRMATEYVKEYKLEIGGVPPQRNEANPFPDAT
jgi:glycosyltransferase involved in cell wall biosynthesis